jgi:hypothetical protein
MIARRLAMLADSVGSVRRESRVWVKTLIGEGHATVRRNRRAASDPIAPPQIEAVRRGQR